MKLETIAISSLVFDPNNARKHSNKNLDAIKGSLTKFGQQKPIVIDAKNIIIAGNGTVAAAKELGWKEIQAVRSSLEGFMQAAYALADNRTAELAEWNFDTLKESLAALDLQEFDIEGIGFTSDDMDFITENSSIGENGKKSSESAVDYTKKIEIPVYEPKGPKPKLDELVNTSKTDELLKQIDAAKIPETEKAFLRLAAFRHRVFDYQNIAEYYAHSSAEVQDLMEKSALVIIDYDKAIENGFVRMSENMSKAYTERGSSDDDSEE